MATLYSNFATSFTPQLKKSIKQFYYIFTYYCSFGDRQNYEYLKIQSFKRLLVDAQIISEPDLDSSKNSQSGSLALKFDLIYAKNNINKNGIDFDSFLNVLTQISILLYGQQSGINGFKTILDTNFKALYQFIRDNTQFGDCIKFLTKTSYDESSFILLKSLSQTLYRIYINYFDVRNHSPSNKPTFLFKLITNFTKDFEITPQMITKTQSFVIFNYILDKKIGEQFSHISKLNSEGEIVYAQWFQEDKVNPFLFKYFNFLQFLILVSLTSARRINEIEVTQVANLGMFLQIIGVSKGFSKLCKTEHISMYLIPNQKLLRELEQKNSAIIPNSLISSPRKSRISTQNHKITQKPTHMLSSSIDPVFLENYAVLHRIFISLCIQGQTIGSNYLSNKKAIDVVQKLGIEINQSQIQVYLASLWQYKDTQNEKEKKNKLIDFQAFLSLLSVISKQHQIPATEIIQKIAYLVAQNQQLIQQSITNPNIGMNRTQYRNCVAMIKVIEPLLKQAFLQQSLPQSAIKSAINRSVSLLSLPSYLKIIHSFQISPLYISKESLVQIFRKSIKKSYDYMNFNQFKDSFIIAIPFVKVGQIFDEKNENSPENKIIVIVERINQSRGAKRLAKKHNRSQDYLIKFRNIFKEFYPETKVNKMASSFAKIVAQKTKKTY